MSDSFYYFFWKFAAVAAVVCAIYCVSVAGGWAAVAFACGIAVLSFDRVGELHWSRRYQPQHGKQS